MSTYSIKKIMPMASAVSLRRFKYLNYLASTYLAIAPVNPGCPVPGNGSVEKKGWADVRGVHQIVGCIRLLYTKQARILE